MDFNLDGYDDVMLVGDFGGSVTGINNGGKVCMVEGVYGGGCVWWRVWRVEGVYDMAWHGVVWYSEGHVWYGIV